MFQLLCRLYIATTPLFHDMSNCRKMLDRGSPVLRIFSLCIFLPCYVICCFFFHKSVSLSKCPPRHFFLYVVRSIQMFKYIYVCECEECTWLQRAIKDMWTESSLLVWKFFVRIFLKCSLTSVRLVFSLFQPNIESFNSSLILHQPFSHQISYDCVYREIMTCSRCPLIVIIEMTVKYVFIQKTTHYLKSRGLSLIFLRCVSLSHR